MATSLKISLASILLASAILAANGQACLPIHRDCSFYRQCLETAVPCGPTGYALGFGEPYCNKFREKVRFSAAGREWLWPTMDCLQNVLVPVPNREMYMTCPDIRSFAFASHSRCYTQPGSSICDLPFTDWMLLFVMISQELNDPATWQQMLEVLQTCSGNRSVN